MPSRHLQCLRCNRECGLEVAYLCPHCSGILEVRYDYRSISADAIREVQLPPGPDIWKYEKLLPVSSIYAMVTLFEGGTPLIKCGNLSERTGLDEVLVKDESRNPSGAFKDRPIAVGISKAKELNRDTVTTASSGNAAASLATYAARSKMKSYVFIPEHTPSEKVTQALVNGAHLIKVRGSYSNAYMLARQAAERFQWFNITTTFLNPYAVEGDKTIAYELFEQLGKGVPDWIFIPTGAGPLLYGIFKGFLELRLFGLIEQLPRMVAVQAEGCAPIVKSFEAGREKVQGWGVPSTIASAIADPLNGYEQDGELVLKTVRSSGGMAVSVSDQEIIEAVYELAGSEGIYAEPAAGASFAGLKKLVEKGAVKRSETAVCVVTGHGLKDPQGVMKYIDVPIVDPDIEEVARVVK